MADDEFVLWDLKSIFKGCQNLTTNLRQKLLTGNTNLKCKLCKFEFN